MVGEQDGPGRSQLFNDAHTLQACISAEIRKQYSRSCGTRKVDNKRGRSSAAAVSQKSRQRPERAAAASRTQAHSVRGRRAGA